MFRWLTRLLLLAYIVLPVLALGLVVITLQQIQTDVEPVITHATDSINTAAAALDSEVRNLGVNFQPLVDSINTLRSGLNSVATFVSSAINVMIDAVNGLTFNRFRIPRFQGIDIPPLVDFSFVNRISENISTIGGQVSVVATTVTDTITARMQMLVLAIILLVGWVLLGFLLMWLTMYLTLWRGRGQTR